MTNAAAIEAPTVGIMHDARDDLRHASDEPFDFDAEFEESMAAGDVMNAIEDLGFPTVLIGNTESLLNGFSEYRKQVDVVFNVVNGKINPVNLRQAHAILEVGGIPYVGSTPESLAIAMNKIQAKYTATAYRIRTPEFAVVSNVDDMTQDDIPEYPVVLKLERGRSHIGINEKFKIDNFGQLKQHVGYMINTYGQAVLVERFIEGREFDVSIIGDDVFGVTEVTMNGKPMGKNHLMSRMVYKDDYGLDVKNVDGDFAECKNIALAAHKSLGCRDFGRADVRVEGSTGKPYFLEINPHPYIGKHGSFNHITRSRGMEYKDMLGTIMKSALSRLNAPVAA